MNDNLRMPGELVTQARSELQRRQAVNRAVRDWIGFSVLGVATAVVVAVCWLTVQTETAAYARGKRDAGAECMAIMGTMAGDTVLPSLRGTHGR
jgi:hypothetical protein